MTDATTGMQIGSVVSISGSAWAVSGESQRPLSEGAPVYKGEEIVTEADSNVEIKFIDDTVLGQGGDSAVRLDDYVFSGDDGSLDFHMIKGVLRVVSGEIVKSNPENFNLTTPMATIGIRGTEVMIQIDHNREFIGVDKLGEGHTVLVSNAMNQVVIDKAGMFSGIDFDGSLIVPDEMPASFIETMVRAVPLTTLGDPPRSPGDPQDITLPDTYQTIQGQTGEYQPGVGQDPPQVEQTDDDDEEPIQLTDAEINALLAMETAAGDDTTSGSSAPLGRVVDVTYDTYVPGQVEFSAPPVAPSSPAPAGSDDTEDDPAVDAAATPEVTGGTTGDVPADNVPGDDIAASGTDAPSAEIPLASETPPADDPPEDSADDVSGTVEDLTVVQDTEAENTAVTYNVLDAQSEATLIDASLSQESMLEGEVVFEADGSITYIPEPGEEGQALIDYTLENGDGTVSTARLTIELAPDSEPEISATDATAVVAEGVITAAGTIDAAFGADDEGGTVELSADDATWDPETTTLTADDGSWAVTLASDGYNYTQYTPLAESAETTAGTPLNVDITATATDADGDMATDTFSVTLIDDGPLALDATVVQSAEDLPVSYNVFTEGGADAGLFGGSLVAAELAEDSQYQGQVIFGTDGTISYQPGNGETGNVVIDYVIEDADGDSAMAQLTITLTPDSQPVITTSSVSGDETDGLVTASGTLSVDYGADATGAAFVLAAAGATWDADTATLAANDGSWEIQTDSDGYTFTQYDALSHTDMTDPDDQFVIDVSVTATDGDGTVTTGSFAVTVDDDGPTAYDATFALDTSSLTAVSYNVFDGGDALTGMDGGALTGATLSAESLHEGTVTYQADGTITYSPVAGETGTVTIDYMITDDDGDTASAQLAIELASNDAYDGEYQPGRGSEIITGTDGDDILDGGQGRDVIFGTGGNDILIGGNSKDAILGGDGNDYLEGGNSNDLLIGGAGDDVLSGGKGSDTYAFTSPYDGMDTLLDFQSAVDKISLYESGFDLYAEDGQLDPAQFVTIDSDVYEGGIDFEGADSGLVYASLDDCSAGTLYFDPNDKVLGDEIALATINECDGSDLVADDIEIV